MMTWLIAEDEADIRILISMMCQLWGHSTMVFDNGQQVWDWLDQLDQDTHEEALPDLLLMDIRMPGKRGNELAQRMRQIPALQRRPIVLMTAYALSDGERQEMMANDGVDAILNKPLPDFEELQTLLHNIHQQKQKTA
jgi:CheY-like chemotaxis protein